MQNLNFKKIIQPECLISLDTKYFRSFAADMFWNRKKQKIEIPQTPLQGGEIADWPDAEWPSYIPKYHLNDFAAIDFEGANGEVTSACSMGVVIVRDNEITDRFYSLMKPVPNHYDFWTTKVHGITYKDTNHAPLFPEVWCQIEGHVKGLPMVAHGKSFDERVLKALHQLYHIPYPNYKFYCTHLGSEKLLPELENHKLQTVALHFGYDLAKNHHNAVADAEACAVIAMNIF